MTRILFIYNRHAGKSKNWFSFPSMIDVMTKQGCLVTAYPTQHPGDAGEAIARWGNDYDRVVVAGGDGTLSQAIAGAIHMEKPPVIGYIPVGSTNDFAKNLELPLGDIPALAKAAVTGVPKTHDLGMFNGKSFLYVAAFGAFTEVSYSTSQRAKNLLGYNAYMLESIKNLPSIKPYHIRIDYDDDQVLEGDFLYGMVSNTTTVGRFRNFPPGNPDLSDGKLEVTLISPVRDMKNMEELSRAFLVSDPTILKSMLTSFSASHIHISGTLGLQWTMDGEDGGAHDEVDIRTLPNAYTIIHGK